MELQSYHENQYFWVYCHLLPCLLSLGELIGLLRWSSFSQHVRQNSSSLHSENQQQEIDYICGDTNDAEVVENEVEDVAKVDAAKIGKDSKEYLKCSQTHTATQSWNIGNAH